MTQVLRFIRPEVVPRSIGTVPAAELAEAFARRRHQLVPRHRDHGLAGRLRAATAVLVDVMAGVGDLHVDEQRLRHSVAEIQDIAPELGGWLDRWKGGAA